MLFSKTFEACHVAKKLASKFPHTLIFEQMLRKLHSLDHSSKIDQVSTLSEPSTPV